MRATSSFAVICALALAGCPEKEDEEDEPHPLEGLYAVTTHTEATPCDAAPTAPSNPFTRFRLAEDSFFGATLLGFFDCSEGLTGEELDDDGCSTSAHLSYSGFGPNDEVDISSCSCASGTCALTGFDGGWDGTADGAELVLDRLTGEVAEDIGDNEDCDPSALLEEHQDELACETQTTIAGARE